MPWHCPQDTWACRQGEKQNTVVVCRAEFLVRANDLLLTSANGWKSVWYGSRSKGSSLAKLHGNRVEYGGGLASAGS